MHHPTADRPIEHPLGHFQTTCAFLTRLRAAQNAYTAPLHRFMYEHRLAKPRMPGIKNVPFLGPVGVMLSSCTMRFAPTWRWAKTHLRAGSPAVRRHCCHPNLVRAAPPLCPDMISGKDSRSRAPDASPIGFLAACCPTVTARSRARRIKGAAPPVAATI
jgi:hypothetical protein